MKTLSLVQSSQGRVSVEGTFCRPLQSTRFMCFRKLMGYKSSPILGGGAGCSCKYERAVLQDRGAGEGGAFCLQAKLSFSCTTILFHLSFCPSFGNVKCSHCGKDHVPEMGRRNVSRWAETWRFVLSPLPMGSKRGGGLIQLWEVREGLLPGLSWSHGAGGLGSGREPYFTLRHGDACSQK